MKSKYVVMITALAGLVMFTSTSRADTPGNHPAYLHALSDLRDARAHLERPAHSPGHWDEKAAIGEIDVAIGEITKAAIRDGKNITEHTPIDAKLEWGGRLNRAKQLLEQAYTDIHNKAEDNEGNAGLKMRALKHISAATELVRAGIVDAGGGGGPPSAGGQHPAYLHALSDLRLARALLERPAHSPGHWDEKIAIAKIDDAIKEIKVASIEDGKPLSDHPPVDVKLEWGGRLQRVKEILEASYTDIHTHAEDNEGAVGLKIRALKHISQATEFVKQGIADAGHR